MQITHFENTKNNVRVNDFKYINSASSSKFPASSIRKAAFLYRLVGFRKYFVALDSEPDLEVLQEFRSSWFLLLSTQ